MAQEEDFGRRLPKWSFLALGSKDCWSATIQSDYGVQGVQILLDDDLVEKKRGLGMYVGEGVREQLLKNEKRVFIDSELLEFQDRLQRLSFILKDLLQEVS